MNRVLRLEPMEHMATQTLLGIQFWDPATGRPVVEGLRVKAQRLSTVEGNVARITVTNKGSGYAEPPNVEIKSGSGKGATATAKIDDGKVSQITVTSGGSSYPPAPNVFITGGGGRGATAIAKISDDGKVSEIPVTLGGSGYTSTPSVLICGGHGRDARATAIIDGKVARITVTSGGSEYTSTPSVEIKGGGGKDAAATAKLSSDGKVSQITIDAGGDGYTSAPRVAITGGGGKDATAEATIEGPISAIKVDSEGSGYISAPVVEITGGGGKDATAEATVAANRIGRSIIGQATPSGVFAFFGLAPEEQVKDDPQQQIWQSIPPLRPVAIDVNDLEGRYLPMSFVVSMPHKGAHQFDLWSAPSRSVPSALSVIHAQVAIGNGENPDPAAYALVEARLANQGNQGGVGPWVYRSLTNEKGTLLLPCPYPPVLTPECIFNHPALDKQTFELNITVRYEGTDKLLPGSDVPSLEAILSQKPAIVITQLNPLETDNSMSAVLWFGQPLMLRTERTDQASDSYLRIQPQ